MENKDFILHKDEKIGIVWELDSYGGVQTCVIVLIKALNLDGIVPTLFCERIPSLKIRDEYGLNFDYELIQFKYSSLKNYHNLIYSLFRHIRISEFHKKLDKIFIFDNDVILDLDIDSIRYVSMPPYYYKSFSTGLKSIIRHYIQKFICLYIPKYQYIKEDKVYINSNYTQEIFVKHFGFNIPVVYPPSLMKLTERRNNKLGRSFVFFSRLHQDKKIEQFIKLSKEFSDQEFIIVGSTNNIDEEKYLERLMFVTKEFKNLEFKINLKSNQIEDILEKVTFFVFTREHEHFGIVTLDMMRLGLIPIVHNSGGQKELVPFEKLRFNDFDDLIKRITYLLSLDLNELKVIQDDVFNNLLRFDNSIYIKNILNDQ